MMQSVSLSPGSKGKNYAALPGHNSALRGGRWVPRRWLGTRASPCLLLGPSAGAVPRVPRAGGVEGSPVPQPPTSGSPEQQVRSARAPPRRVLCCREPGAEPCLGVVARPSHPATAGGPQGTAPAASADPEEPSLLLCRGFAPSPAPCCAALGAPRCRGSRWQPQTRCQGWFEPRGPSLGDGEASGAVCPRLLWWADGSPAACARPALMPRGCSALLSPQPRAPSPLSLFRGARFGVRWSRPKREPLSPHRSPWQLRGSPAGAAPRGAAGCSWGAGVCPLPG